MPAVSPGIRALPGKAGRAPRKQIFEFAAGKTGTRGEDDEPRDYESF
jgi:hypothetical protein